MPLSPFPLPGADLFNAGNALRDRGRYLRSGTFTWLPSGSTAFTGVVVGYAAYTGNSDVITQGSLAGASVGIDGGTAYPVHGGHAVAINRYAASSVQVNGGVAWGVAYPANTNLPSYKHVLDAVDRMHKDGAWASVSHVFDYSATGSGFNLQGFVGTGTDVVNQGGAGIFLAANLAQRPNGWSTGQTMTSALDVTIDGTYRFSLVNGHKQEVSQSSQDNGWVAVNGAFGFIPFASSLNVKLRKGSDGGQRIEAYTLFVTGA
jgi:hypothetical protein